MAKVPMRTLGDGTNIPAFGLGTLNMGENEVGDIIKGAIQSGFRLIDTSPVYGNEAAIGRALKESISQGLCKREDLFIISKLWITDRNNVEDALRQSLNNLQLEYVDLYLIHYMTPDLVKDTLMVDRVSIQEVWFQMEHCRENKLCRSIGVMNCPVVMFLEILTFCNIKPSINCLEMHPYFTQEEASAFYRKLKIPLAAYAPLAPQENVKIAHHESLKNLDLLKEGLIQELAKKYQKTAA
jgi:diketogulonate reductase-like aldo/keto reductase